MVQNIFERGGLQQTTGDLQERWGQGDSNIVGYSAAVSGDVNTYTVTAGRKLFIKDITLSSRNATATIINFRDGAGGTYKVIVQMKAIAGDTQILFFSTPLVFETDVYVDMGNPDIVNITWTGWEE